MRIDMGNFDNTDFDKIDIEDIAMVVIAILLGLGVLYVILKVIPFFRG